MSGKLPGLDEEQVRKAVIALLKYIGKNKSDSNDLFDDDEFLYLVGRGVISMHALNCTECFCLVVCDFGEQEFVYRIVQ